ncbi:MAG: lipid A export permease/ATP-binding protein MsbA [Gammaproteobacteria bacterium]|nr:lipid A export permease/ATP-binding protein MsbA [Gammaproteobacteria bacterium]MCH9744366.1 lipid A export permease/ATP-binding protein MsbA [Gammaproteobacteria bacterium]
MSNKIPRKRELTLIKRVIKLYRPYIGLFVLGIIATALMSGLDSGFAFSLKYFIDKGVVHPDPHFIKWIPLGIIAIAFGRTLASVSSRYCMNRLSSNVVVDLRFNIFKKLLTLPAREYDHTSSGHLISTLLYNTGQVVQAGIDVFVSGLQDGSSVIGLLVVLFVISWKLALIIFTCGPPIAYVARWASRRMRGISRDLQTTIGEITHCAEESIKNYKMIRIYGGQEFEERRITKTLKTSLHRQLKIVITNSLSVGLVPFLVCIPMAGVFYVFKSAFFSISAGSFVAFMTSLVMIIKPIRRVVSFNSQIQKGLAGADSIFKLLDTPDELDDGQHKLTVSNGLIEYRNVSFRYLGSEQQAVRDISFSMKPGQMVALVGRSGSGKTTVTNLLPRFYDVSSGEILLDGVPVQDYVLGDLRAQFSLVTQDVTLFNDTVANNIAYGQKENVSDEAIIEAAEAAYAMEFINDLSDGIHTLIGENGVLLSGGQRQRIAIARAILRKAPITLLDEATSALDTETERHIQKALNNLMQQSTSLVIAHRLSTIEHADWILVMQEGRLVEQGTHEALLKKNAVYARLHEMQFSVTA